MPVGQWPAYTRHPLENLTAKISNLSAYFRINFISLRTAYNHHVRETHPAAYLNKSVGRVAPICRYHNVTDGIRKVLRVRLGV